LKQIRETAAASIPDLLNVPFLQVDITSGQWIVVYTDRDRKNASEFVDVMAQVCRPMGIQLGTPKMVKLDRDRVDAYVACLREHNNKNVSYLPVWKTWQIFLNLKLHKMSKEINKLNFPSEISVKFSILGSFISLQYIIEISCTSISIIDLLIHLIHE